VKRRELITLVGGLAFSWPLAVRAQQAAVPVIGYLSARSPDAEESMRTPILAALEEAGFVVGRARGAPAAVGRRFGSSAADAVRVDEECDQARIRHDFAQETKAFWAQFSSETAHATPET